MHRVIQTDLNHKMVEEKRDEWVNLIKVFKIHKNSRPVICILWKSKKRKKEGHQCCQQLAKIINMWMRSRLIDITNQFQVYIFFAFTSPNKN